MSRVRTRWLSLITYHSVISDIVLPATLAVLVRLILLLAGISPGNQLGREVVLDALVLVLALLAVDRSRTWGMRRLVRQIGEIAQHSTQPGSAFLYSLAEQRLVETVALAHSLDDDGFYASTTQDIAQLCDVLFEHGSHPYVGTDSHAPNAFLKRYGWYLQIQAQSIKSRPFSPKRDSRILTISANTLATDYFRDPESYLQFRGWHDAHDVALMRADPTFAEKLSNRYGLAGADLGLWPNYALLFYPRDDGGVKLGIRFPDSRDGHLPSYEDIVQYVRALESHASPLTDDAPGLDLIDAPLARAWADYVDTAKRTDPTGPLGRLLRDAIEDESYVLDAAAGVGCESILLLKHGCSVQSNEVNPHLAERAQNLAAQCGFSLYLTRYLWETLPDSIPGNFRFDAVLALGDSLALLTNADRRRASLRAFWQVLSPRGVLIVDERNYEPILEARELILKDPIRYFGPATKGDVMFSGKSVRGYPTAISPERLVWDFFFNVPGVRRHKDLARQGVGSAPLELYPFKHGELFSLLREARFERIRVFADLQEIQTSGTEMPSRAEVGEVDFLTYVAYKSGI